MFQGLKELVCSGHYFIEASPRLAYCTACGKKVDVPCEHNFKSIQATHEIYPKDPYTGWVNFDTRPEVVKTIVLVCKKCAFEKRIKP